MPSGDTELQDSSVMEPGLPCARPKKHKQLCGASEGTPSDGYLSLCPREMRAEGGAAESAQGQPELRSSTLSQKVKKKVLFHEDSLGNWMFSLPVCFQT